MQKCEKVLACQLNRLVGQKPYERQHAAAWWPRMACSPLCRFTYEMRRFHGSCLWCRCRRVFYGKIERSKYHFNPYFGSSLIVPNDATVRSIFKRVYADRTFLIMTPKGPRMKKVNHMLVNEIATYTLWVDNNRRFRHVKDIFLDKVFKKIEELENTEKLSFPKRLFKRYLYNLAEMLAN